MRHLCCFEDNHTFFILATTDSPHMSSQPRLLATESQWFKTHLSENLVVIQNIEAKEQKEDGFIGPLTLDTYLAFCCKVCSQWPQHDPCLA